MYVTNKKDTIREMSSKIVSPSRVRQVQRESVDIDPLSMIFDSTNAASSNITPTRSMSLEKRKTMNVDDVARSFLNSGRPSSQVPVRDIGSGMLLKGAACTDLMKCRELSGNGQWTALLNVSQRALAMSSIYGEQRAEIRIHEVRAYIRMERYSEAEKACEVLESGKKEQDLPFGLRVMKAELPHVSKNTEATLSCLQSLLNEITTTNQSISSSSSSSSSSNDRTAHETLRTLMNSSSCLCTSQELKNTERLLWQRVLLLLLAKYSIDTRSAVSYCLRLARTISDQKSVAYADAMLHAAQILIRTGSIGSAESIHKHLHSVSSKSVLESVRYRIEWSNLLIVNGKYSEALVNLEDTMRRFDTDMSLQNDSVLREDMLATLSNNIAIASLHCSEIMKAVNCLENFLRENVQCRMHHTLLFNLCTLYEVAFGTEIARTKKIGLKMVSERLGLKFGNAPFRL